MDASHFELDPARLRAARKTAKLTQTQLAEKTGLDQSHISKLEKGRTGASLETLRTLANATGVSVAYLMGGAGEASDDLSADPRAAILGSYDAPAGLRDLAASRDLIETLRIQPEEWRALSALAAGWDGADLARRDGWLQILLSLRTAGSLTGASHP